jgi:hypothetical protein
MGNGSSVGKRARTSSPAEASGSSGGGILSGGKNNGQGSSHTFQMQDFSIDVPLETNMGIVNHYMPTTFPVQIVFEKEMVKRVHNSWALIMDGTADGMKNNIGDKAGIVLFYDEFFFRLFKRARIFLDIFHDPAKRGEVLMKALGLLLRTQGDGNRTETEKIFYLGRNHRFKAMLRPWMFSVYITTCLETLMFWLGGDADMDVGEAWTCLASYVLRRMLISYLPGMVVPNEYYQNYDIDAVRKILTQSIHSKYSSRHSSAAGSNADHSLNHHETAESVAESQGAMQNIG